MEAESGGVEFFCIGRITGTTRKCSLRANGERWFCARAKFERTPNQEVSSARGRGRIRQVDQELLEVKR